jgi:uncharacterized protein YqgC (DUF456 family)
MFSHNRKSFDESLALIGGILGLVCGAALGKSAFGLAVLIVIAVIAARVIAGRPRPQAVRCGASLLTLRRQRKGQSATHS